MPNISVYLNKCLPVACRCSHGLLQVIKRDKVLNSLVTVFQCSGMVPMF